MFPAEKELRDLPIGTELRRIKDGRIYRKFNFVDTSSRDIPFLSPEGQVVFYPFVFKPTDKLSDVARIVRRRKKK